MIFEGDATEEEMVLEFVRAEIGSMVDWAPLVGNQADLSNPRQNRMRAALLDAKRGYARRIWIFDGFPIDTVWRRARLSLADFPSLRYVRSSPFKQLAGPSLRVNVGAQCIREKTFDPSDRKLMKSIQKIEGIAQSICKGITLPSLILADAGSEYVVVEGNHRATALVLADSQDSATALVGSSPTMHLWATKDWR